MRRFRLTHPNQMASEMFAWPLAGGRGDCDLAPPTCVEHVSGGG